MPIRWSLPTTPKRWLWAVSSGGDTCALTTIRKTVLLEWHSSARCPLPVARRHGLWHYCYSPLERGVDPALQYGADERYRSPADRYRAAVEQVAVIDVTNESALPQRALLRWPVVKARWITLTGPSALRMRR